MTREQIPLQEFLARLKAQGVPRRHVALRCPACGTVQSMNSLIQVGAGDTEDDVEKYVGFSCIGRWLDAGPADFQKTKPQNGRRGCNWTLGGLLQLHKLEIVTDDGEHHPRFEVASADEAKALMAAAP